MPTVRFSAPIVSMWHHGKARDGRLPRALPSALPAWRTCHRAGCYALTAVQSQCHAKLGVTGRGDGMCQEMKRKHGVLISFLLFKTSDVYLFSLRRYAIG